MSRENKWERRHAAEDERLSGRWSDEVEGKEGPRNDRRGEEKRREKEWAYINPLQRGPLPSYL